MTDCPRCYRPLARNESMAPGHVVLGCRNCNRFLVEGTKQWVAGGQSLRQLLITLGENEKFDQASDKAAMMSPSDDPRWESIS